MITVAVCVCLMATAGATLPIQAASGVLPATFEGFAQSSGLNVGVVKPAMLPTSDEVATLALPYSAAETSSSPLGRAIGSWLWPGETVADAKSLLLVGADPGADEAACKDREDGRTHAAVIATVPNPAGAPITITDPTDNPCGAAGVKQILTGKIDTDPSSPTYGTRTGGVVRALPDYPFWARAQYPANDDADTQDRAVLCAAPGALPEEPWHTPRDVCATDATPQSGVATATALHERQHASATLGAITAGPVTVTAMVAHSTISWRDGVLVAQSSTRIDDVAIGSPAPFLVIESLRASAIASSDGLLTHGSLTVIGAKAALPGLPATTDCSQAKPCPVTVGDEGITPSIPVNDLVRQALKAIQIRIGEVPLEAAGATITAGASARGPGTSIASDRRSASVAGLIVDIAGATSLEGRTITRLILASARASTLASEPSGVVTPPEAGAGGGILPKAHDAQPASGPAGQAGESHVAGTRFVRAAPVAAVPLPASKPIPPAVALLAFAAILAGASALIAFGVWETEPETGP